MNFYWIQKNFNIMLWLKVNFDLDMVIDFNWFCGCCNDYCICKLVN